MNKIKNGFILYLALFVPFLSGGKDSKVMYSEKPCATFQLKDKKLAVSRDGISLGGKKFFSLNELRKKDISSGGNGGWWGFSIMSVYDSIISYEFFEHGTGGGNGGDSHWVTIDAFTGRRVDVSEYFTEKSIVKGFLNDRAIGPMLSKHNVDTYKKLETYFKDKKMGAIGTLSGTNLSEVLRDFTILNHDKMKDEFGVRFGFSRYMGWGQSKMNYFGMYLKPTKKMRKIMENKNIEKFFLEDLAIILKDKCAR